MCCVKMRSYISCILIWVLYLWHYEWVLGAKSGPYKSLFTRAEPCANPSQPIDTDPASLFYTELYNTTTQTNLLRGNITVVRDHKFKKMQAKSYLWVSGKWKVTYVMNNIGCNRAFFPALCVATGVKYDPGTCNMSKGNYVFQNFDLNKLQHTWMSSQEFGRVMWRVEVLSHSGSVFCWEFETFVEPLK